MKRFSLLLLTAVIVINLAFADTLIVNRTGLSTYIQRTEFILPEGESVVGPIKLLPVGKAENVLIKPDNKKDVSFIGYVFEPQKEKWIENMLGKVVSLEGEGRVISGTIISVKDGYIIIDTKKGIVISTFPNFPSRLSSSLSWQDTVAPKITVKLRSKKPQNAVINISYPVEGFSYYVNYVANIEKDSLLIQEFYHIKNDTSLYLKDIELSVKEGDKINKLYNKTYIEPYSSKVLLTRSIRIDKISGKTVNIPAQYNLNGAVINLYKDGIFLGTIKVQNSTISIQ
ncbi:MAG: hypothetical protein N2Z80_01205 [Hydrogenothermaceae bacterium]|nr:hypothetical protein [Hydrogenothermaceae bacterium]